MSPIEQRAHSRIAESLVHAGCLGVVGLLLISVGGPLATDDLWWHLELGELYRQFGPWLTEDPRLHTALGPPAPNAWLFDLGLATLARSANLHALRVLHVALVAAIVALAWRALAKAAGARTIASLGTALFVACASYRLVQLRPELATIAATFALYLLVLEPRTLSWRRVAWAIGLCGLWANLHPGYLLGPLLILAGAGALAIAALVGVGGLDGPSRPRRQRAMRLATAGAGGLLASGLNPDGFAALARYGQAGVDAVRASAIVDEWRPLDLFSWPTPLLPPTPLAWLCLWLILSVALGLLCREGLAWLRAVRATREAPTLDPVLLALAAAGGLAPFVAIRFAWLCLFPLLLIAAASQHSASAQTILGDATGRPRRALGWIGSAAALVLLVGYAQSAPVTRSASLIAALTTSLPPSRTSTGDGDGDGNGDGKHATSAQDYRQAYDADRYYAHAVWFLRDTRVEGRLFNPYFTGGFFEYWLSPRLQAFADGSLNFPASVLEDHALILTQGGDLPEFDLGARLDAYGIDFFVGVGLPTPGPAGRPWRYSSHHLERDPDWLLVYRGLRSAVYLRRADRNRRNLERIAAYYARAGVPFSPETGLDVLGALEAATDWAIANGVAPIDYPELVRAARRAPPRMRRIARERLASTYATLGLYARAIDLDSHPTAARFGAANAPARERRLAWCRMRLDRSDDTSERARRAAMTPVFDRRDAGQLKAVERPAVARVNRSG